MPTTKQLNQQFLDELRDELINEFTEYFMNDCAPGNPGLQAEYREMYREYFFTYLRNEFMCIALCDRIRNRLLNLDQDERNSIIIDKFRVAIAENPFI